MPVENTHVLKNKSHRVICSWNLIGRIIFQIMQLGIWREMFTQFGIWSIWICLIIHRLQNRRFINNKKFILFLTKFYLNLRNIRAIFVFVSNFTIQEYLEVTDIYCIYIAKFIHQTWINFLFTYVVNNENCCYFLILLFFGEKKTMK